MMLLRLFITIAIVVMVGAYTLPENVVSRIPFGPETQQFTKKSVPLIVKELDAITGGALSRLLENIKNKAQEEVKQDIESTKEDVKDELKDAAGKVIDAEVDKIIAP